ncbi:MAG: LamG-like jellyroll fold domain-containing protein [Luteolibacter sp.]|uniref:LamG-like jellyroll fold domain-containing protein n=1 Tax=Luteolibacter sp. TaxID=1962973 RepID=UPI003267B0E5
MKTLASTWLILASVVQAHPVSFNSTIGYSSSQPSGAAASISNWTGAAFDAANIGGSGVNADGGANNGAANDASTFVANNQPVQGQTFTTGGNANGYDVTGITARMAGYTNNTASGTNLTSWNLNATNGPLIATIGKVTGTTRTTLSNQNFTAGGTGNPGTGSSANGSGNYITFNLPFPVHLDPNTTYGFDFIIGNGASNYFEWLGTSASPYAGGTAYTRSGSTITPLTGDRVFMVDMTASGTPYAPFAHPGALHTQADFDRMKAKITASAEPWISDYNILTASPYAQTTWGAYDTDYINRGGAAANNYTRSQQDAQAIYELSLRWKTTGNTAYADKAVQIANVWSGLLGVTGDSNQSLAGGICGYLFAIGGEMLSTYPGWTAGEKQAYKDMMMRVFYPSNFDFLWRHHGTPVNSGGNTHYRLNWDAANIASMAAIGILCDNKAVYQQALDFFKFGAGNGRVERAVWFIHPDGMGQTEEIGRDQPHNMDGWYSFSLLCQMAWNQGDDLFTYDNNRVLRAFEMNAKYNLGNDVLWVYHRNTDITYTESIASGSSFLPMYELVYNHYANVAGIAAPYSKLAMNVIRPEDRPHTEYHPSQVDWLGLGSLTFARDNTSTSAAPGGLLAQWSKNQVTLSWWGSATATSYQIQRTANGVGISGPYATLGTATEPNLNFTDTTVANGGAYYYKVVAVTPSGNLESAPLLVNQALVASYTFEGNANDGTGTRHATAKGGTTAPGYAAGFGGGQAISLNGTDQYVQLPVGSGNSRDVTLSGWVYWNGGNAWQRVFDFGSEIEKYMMLTVKDGTGKIGFQMTTSRATDGTITLTGPTMPTATWTHLAVTFNGETATLYVNGLPVAAGSSPRLAPMFSQTFCYLGRSMWNADPYFSGRIDNFRIYNYGLSGAAVYNLWGQSTNHAPAFSTNPIGKSAATEDTNYSTGSQTLAGLATDADGGTLTYSKIAGPAWLAVASNGALSGTPANADVGSSLFVVRVADSSGATDDANLYITVANTNDAPIWASNPLTKPAVSQNVAYSGTLADSASDVDAGSSITYSKISGPPWLGVAADGSLTGMPSVSDVGVNAFVVRATDNIGALADATLNITVAGNALQARYTLDGSGADSLGGASAIISGNATYNAGVVGQSLTFDGSTNYATLGTLPNLVYKDITVAAWVWWDGGGANQRIFDFGSGTDEYLYLSPSTGSNMRFAVKENGVEQTLDTTALPIGNWAHIAVTLGGNTATLYVNGVAKATSSAITNDPSNINLALNYLGKSQFAADPLFAGKIDDFRLYNYALNASEVSALLSGVPAIIPTGLDAAASSSKVTLTWNASATAQTYNVKRGTTSGSYTPIATGLTTPIFLDTAVVTGATYYYVVSAVNGQGESANSAEVSAAVSDLVARVKFDESSGTNAADISGNGNNGTLVNTPTWVSGYYGNSVNLAGGAAGTASQHVTLPTGLTNGLTDFTVSCWVKIGAFVSQSRIFDFGTATTPSATAGAYMFLTPQFSTTGTNAAKMRFAITTAGYNNEKAIVSSTALAAGSWAHIAVTLTGNTGRLYLNGDLVGTNATMTLSPSSLGNATLNYLGRSRYAADPYLNGALDDFRIYSRALSAGEISAFAHPAAGIPTGFTAVAGDGKVTLSWSPNATTSYTLKRSATSGGPYLPLVSGVTDVSYIDTSTVNETTYYYVISGTNTLGTSPDSAEAAATPTALRVHLKFEETTGATTAADSSGRGANATLVNSPTFEAGKIGNALRLTQSSSQYATLPAGVVSDLTTATLMTWVKTGSIATWQRVFDFGTGATSYMFLTTQYTGTAPNTNKLRFAITNTGTGGEQRIDSPTATPANAWVHVAIVLNGTTGTLYLNGAQVGQNAAMTLNPSSLGNTALNYLGKSQFADPYLNSALDDFRIYSRAMAPEEIAAFASPLAAPQNLEAVADVQDVDLSWDAVPYAASYSVKSSTTSGGPYTVIASGLGTTSYTHPGLPLGVTRYYVVDASNVTGTSGNSAEASATPNSPPITPGEIAGSTLSFSDLTASNGNLTMTVVASQTGHTYQIQYSPELSNGSWTSLGSAQAGNGGALQFVLPINLQGKGFYRIIISQQ